MSHSRNKHTLELAARVRQLPQSGADADTIGAPLPTNTQVVGPWFNSADGAMYLRQATRAAFRTWARRHVVIPIQQAGLVLYAKADIDRVLGVMGRGRSATGRNIGPVVVYGNASLLRDKEAKARDAAIEALRQEVASLRDEVRNLRAALEASR